MAFVVYKSAPLSRTKIKCLKVSNDSFSEDYNPSAIQSIINNCFFYLQDARSDLVFESLGILAEHIFQIFSAHFEDDKISVVLNDLYAFHLDSLIHVIIDTKGAETRFADAYCILSNILSTDEWYPIQNTFLSEEFCVRLFSILSLSFEDSIASCETCFAACASSLRNVLASNPDLAKPLLLEQNLSRLYQITLMSKPPILEDMLAICSITVRYPCDKISNDTEPMLNLFLSRLEIGGECLLEAANGVFFCLQITPGAADLILTSGKISTISSILFFNDIRSVNVVIEILRKIVKYGSINLLKTAIKEIDWMWIQGVEKFSDSKLLSHCFFSIRSMVNHLPQLSEVLFYQGTFDFLLKYAKNGAYDERVEAMETLAVSLPSISDQEKLKIIISGGLIEGMTSFEWEGDAKFERRFANCALYLIENYKMSYDCIKQLEETVIAMGNGEMDTSEIVGLFERAIEEESST